METIGMRVRMARQRAGKTLTEAAEESGCTRAALAKMEQGTRDKVLIRFARLAKALDTTMEDLIPAEALAMGGEDPEEDDDEIPF